MGSRILQSQSSTPRQVRVASGSSVIPDKAGYPASQATAQVKRLSPRATASTASPRATASVTPPKVIRHAPVTRRSLNPPPMQFGPVQMKGGAKVPLVDASAQSSVRNQALMAKAQAEAHARVLVEALAKAQAQAQAASQAQAQAQAQIQALCSQPPPSYSMGTTTVPAAQAGQHISPRGSLGSAPSQTAPRTVASPEAGRTPEATASQVAANASEDHWAAKEAEQLQVRRNNPLPEAPYTRKEADSPRVLSARDSPREASPREEKPDTFPEVVRVVGRRGDRENASLNGEYKITAMYSGKPVYQKPGTTVIIRYWPPEARWLIDREGNRQSNVCNAFAEQRRARHPAEEDLIWRVWESSQSRHMVDPEFFVTSNPETIQCRGRRAGKENDRLSGEYRIIGLHQGKPAYQKIGTDHVMRYWPQDDRWLIDFEGLRDCGICNAFCDARGTSHPGHGYLQWNVWETTRGKHISDPDVRTFVAPSAIEIMGQEIIAENRCINGTYELIGLEKGRPAYRQGRDGHCIKFNSEKDQWQIDPQDQGAVCKAFAEAMGTEHPGCRRLTWHVWASACRRYITDNAMRAFTAPRFVEIKGRGKGKSNRSINGVYHICGFHKGQPAYKKVGKVPTNHIICYRPGEDRWVIEAEGRHESGLANAFANAYGADHPGFPTLIWHLWEESWGQHMADEDVVAAPWVSPEHLVEEENDYVSASRRSRSRGRE